MLSCVLQETLSDVMDKAPIGVHLAFVGYSYTATRSHSYHILSQYQSTPNEWGIIQNYINTVVMFSLSFVLFFLYLLQTDRCLGSQS